ncbi:MAG TPA: hypothetical protein DEO83_03330, partial [Lachnospiraceae bacterium]|nr:hypothetical protein [Lachnospiraceae bacterium]
RSGKYGKYMMRASASAQVSVDYKSEEDMVRKLSVLQKISPILMILMENKAEEDSTLPGVTDKKHLLRIQEWDDLDPDRTGFVPHSLSEDGWEELPQNQLLVYKNGELIYEGEKHEFTYVHDEEKMKLMFLEYSGL